MVQYIGIYTIADICVDLEDIFQIRSERSSEHRIFVFDGQQGVVMADANEAFEYEIQ